MARKNEEGQALLTTALAMGVLMGFLGLAIDIGVLRYEKRLQQSAADAAAVAGASDLAYGGYVAGAQNASAANGFTDNGGGEVSNCTSPGAAIGTVCVQVNNPPQTGPHAGSPGYVEVLVASVQRTYFMPVLGINQSTVVARAVAGNLTGGACLYTLDPNTDGIEGININGNPTLNAPTCNIVDNGNFSTHGGAYSVVAATVSVSGTESGKDKVTCYAQPADCPAVGAPPAADPLSYLTPPSVGTPMTFDPSNIAPGTYSSISFSGNGTYTFPTGTYVLDGGSFSCSGTPTIQGSNVMFYFTNGATFNCAGNDTIQLSAPSSGPYAGILFYQDPNDTVGPTVGGNVGSSFDGALYFPKSQVTFFGNTSLSVAMVVAGSVALNGNPTVNLTGNSGLPPGVHLVSNSTLVE